MTQTIRVTQKMRSVINAFKAIYPETNWIQELNEADAISAILSEWTRQNYPSYEANEILLNEKRRIKK